MFGFISNLWKKRKVNRTQSAVLGSCGEMLMCLPSDTAAWVVAKFNEMDAALEAKETELEMSRRRVRRLASALEEVAEVARPYVAGGGLARKVFDTAAAAAKV